MFSVEHASSTGPAVVEEGRRKGVVDGVIVNILENNSI